MMGLSYIFIFVISEVIPFTFHSEQKLNKLLKLVVFINLVKLFNKKINIMR